MSENAIVSTGEKSFVKLKFKDGTVLSISPNSKIKIEKIKDSSPPLVALLVGNLRAQVKKNPRNDYGFFIKNKTASLGVRGTDFKIMYNKKNKITSAVTFSGKVAFVNTKNTHSFDSPESMDEYDDSYVEVLADSFDNDRAKLIIPGELSGSYPGYKETTFPVALSAIQFQALKNGVDSGDTLVINDSDEVSFVSASTQVSPPTNDILIPRPVVGYTKENYPTNIAPTPGGYLDLETGNYVPPEGFQLDPLEGFVLDKNSNKILSGKALAFIRNVNSSLKNSMGKLKDLARLDEVTHKSSGVFKFDGTIAHKTLDSKNWLIYPKG